jgi:hypothetical protein
MTMAPSDIGGSPETRTGPGDQIQDRARLTKDALGAVGQEAADAAGRIRERGRDARRRVQAVARKFNAALDKSLEHQTMVTLIAAAIAGFRLGALWKS